MMSDAHIYTVFPPTNYRRTRKLAKKRGLDMDLLDWVIDQLAQDLPLPANWKDHQLKGNLQHFRECHIGASGDWLLVYEKRESNMILYLFGTGSHTDLFNQ
jgi:mRNA interferase YafQ